LFLTLPAAVGLLVLARPLVALFFQHGMFESEDTIQTALALRYYVIGMVFAAIDLPLVFAFYARQDTVRPALVGVAGVGLYTLIALLTFRALGMVGLILANDAQLAGHALIMLWLFVRQVGTLQGQEIGSLLFQSALGSAIMGGGAYAAMRVLSMLCPWEGKLRWAVMVAGGGLVGGGIYLGVCALLRVRELELLKALIGRLWTVAGTE
jgi:putative peptidoglycan lipid II flippase